MEIAAIVSMLFTSLYLYFHLYKKIFIMPKLKDNIVWFEVEDVLSTE
ncbi:hypothetical protein STFR1_120013 [Bacillus vallismortis]